MRPPITPNETLKERWERFAALYGKPGRTITYEDFALKMQLTIRDARETLNWSVGQELTRVVQRGLFEILPEQRPENWNKTPNHVCAGCGKEFYYQGFKRWCSAICADNSRKKPIACAICGKLFYTKMANKKMCSSSCRNEHLRRVGVARYKDKTPEQKAEIMRKQAKTPTELEKAAARARRRTASRLDKRQWKEATT